MRDWRTIVREQLAGARLSAGQEADVVEELAQHLEDRYRELVNRGTDRSTAEQLVRAELQASVPLEKALRTVRPRSGGAPLGGSGERSALLGVWHDLRFAVRMFRLSPGFTSAAIIALGLGAGAAAAVFSLLNGIVLRPLPYAQPEQLVMLWDTNAQKNLQHEPLSPVTFLDYRNLRSAFVDAAAWWRPEINLADDTGEPMRVSTVEVSENLFDVLGVHAVIGRTFPRDSTLEGHVREAVISHELWRTRFGGNRNVLGKSVRLDGFPWTIVGVMPAGFHFPDETNVWQRLLWPLSQHSRGAHFMGAVARMRPGVTVEQANSELANLGKRIANEFPRTNTGWAARAIPLSNDIAGVFRPGLFALFGASGLLLLIACINVANLLLARATGRQTEIAIRSALGASRTRLLRQLLLESLVLAAFGALAGFLVAVAATRGFLAWTPIQIPRAADVGVDLRVLVFAVGVTILTALVFGFAPALMASRRDLQSALKDTSRGATVRRAGYARRILVITQVALAVALLCGAGLLVRSVAALVRESTGVDSSGVLSVDVTLPSGDYREWPRVEQFYARLLAALRARPEIGAVGVSNFLPLEPGWRMPFGIPGSAPTTPEEAPRAQYHSVDEGYLPALGVRVLRGRNFNERDRADAPGVVLINEVLARQYWPGEDPVGKRISSSARGVGPLGRRLITDDDHEIIGVVADVKNTSLKSAAEPAIYATTRQFPFNKLYFLIRPSGDALAALRAELQRLDPNIPLGKALPLDRVLVQAADPPRFVMLLMSVFALLALTLAAVGIYGILSYGVSQRAREIGVRLALGARPVDVLKLVVREGVGLALVGSLAGVVAAAAAGRFLSALLYGVRPVDPTTMVLVSALVITVAGAACLAPARRAAAADPMSTFRS